MNIVFGACTENYPKSFSANNTKISYMARGLKELGNSVTIINKPLGDNNNLSCSILEDDYGNNAVLFPRSVKPILSLLKNLVKSAHFLKQIRKKSERNVLILDVGFFPLFLFYKIVASILGYKVVHIISEWPLAFNMSFVRKVDAIIYTYSFGYFCDGILPISKYLEDKIQRFHKPFLRTPILSSYNPVCKQRNTLDGDPYFVYCGNIGYRRVLDLMIKAFSEVSLLHTCKLKLVLYGSKVEIDSFRNSVQESLLHDKIEILTKVPSSELQNLYVHSTGLLIPLNPNSQQDKHRFSQKIAEYLSSASPIITNKVGAIEDYFVNEQNSYIVEYSSLGFKSAMLNILNNRELASKVGEQGYILGKKYFNYRTYSQSLIAFLTEL